MTMHLNKHCSPAQSNLKLPMMHVAVHMDMDVLELKKS